MCVGNISKISMCVGGGSDWCVVPMQLEQAPDECRGVETGVDGVYESSREKF